MTTQVRTSRIRPERRTGWSPFAAFLRPVPFDEWEDPQAAPAAHKGPDSYQPWTLRRGWQNLLWMYLFGLVFLLFSVGELFDATVPLNHRVTSAVFVVVIGIAYACSAWMADATLAVRAAYIGAFVAFLIGTSLWWGLGWTGYGVYVAIMFGALIPWRQARFLIVGWSAVLLVLALAVGDWTPAVIALIAGSVAIAMGGSIESGRAQYKLSRAEQRVSTLAIAAERERIGRDLHDILGHSLTAISIKSTLAARLAHSDPQAAKAQILEVNEIARQALADVRATASGIKHVRVPGELASSRSVLLAAGMEARVPSAIEPMPDDVSELFGYVIREAVTNVVRHSDATTCAIAVSAGEVSIADDGVGITARGLAQAGSTRGSGLVGLTARVTAAGGSLAVESPPDGGTVVRASLSPAARRQMAAGPDGCA